VTLEKYPFVQDKERGIWTTPDGSKVAWFKDPVVGQFETDPLPKIQMATCSR
jgi:hypothetical protein